MKAEELKTLLILSKELCDHADFISGVDSLLDKLSYFDGSKKEIYAGDLLPLSKAENAALLTVLLRKDDIYDIVGKLMKLREEL